MKNFTIAKLLVIAIVAVNLVSCAQQQYSYATYKENQARKVEASEQKFVVTPLTADLEVVSQERITYVATYGWDRSFNIDHYKVRALTDASLEHSADAIVGALTQIETLDKGTQIKITVSGYPAVYKNFRKGTTEDIEIINAAKTPVITTAAAKATVPVSPYKKLF